MCRKLTAVIDRTQGELLSPCAVCYSRDAPLLKTRREEIEQ